MRTQRWAGGRGGGCSEDRPLLAGVDLVRARRRLSPPPAAAPRTPVPATPVPAVLVGHGGHLLFIGDLLGQDVLPVGAIGLLVADVEAVANHRVGIDVLGG